MISALSFIPRGAAKEVPEQAELSAEELEQLVQKSAGMTLDELDDAPPADDDSEEEMSDSDASDKDMDEQKEGEGAGAADAASDPEALDKEAQLLKELKMGTETRRGGGE